MLESLSPGQGQGQGSDFQLPDIIQSQQELQERMKQLFSEALSRSAGSPGGDGSGTRFADAAFVAWSVDGIEVEQFVVPLGRAP